MTPLDAVLFALGVLTLFAALLVAALASEDRP